MRGAFLMRRLTALTCYLPLLIFIHCCKAASTTPIRVLCHTSMRLELVSQDYTEHGVNAI